MFTLEHRTPAGQLVTAAATVIYNVCQRGNIDVFKKPELSVSHNLVKYVRKVDETRVAKEDCLVILQKNFNKRKPDKTLRTAQIVFLAPFKSELVYYWFQICKM